MNYLLSGDQSDLLDGLRLVLERAAGPERTMRLGLATYDDELQATLDQTGYLMVLEGEGTGPLEAGLVVELLASFAAGVTASAQVLIAPRVLGESIPGPIALGERHAPFVRFAPSATTLLGLDGDEAVVASLEPGEITPVRTTFGVPVGRVPERTWEGANRLGPGSGDCLRRWWRCAIALEQAGLLAAALRITVDHANTRVQFGHPIAAFQAVQHRLAECAVLVEGARWLALECAHHEAPAEAAAVACTQATLAAIRVVAETHQLSGAIGFTKEYPLHVFTSRAKGLTLELGGVVAHSRAISSIRWGIGK